MKSKTLEVQEVRQSNHYFAVIGWNVAELLNNRKSWVIAIEDELTIIEKE